MTDKKELLGTAPVGKLLFKLALPTVVAQLINMLYNVVDRIYIGHMPEVGDLALTGVGVCMPLIMLVSAFAALVGYDDAVEETARVTDDMIEQSEEMKAVIDEKLRYLSERIGEMPTVIVTYFMPDKKKSGGEYKIFEGRVKRLDDYDAVMIFEDGKRISYDKIYSVEIKEK